MLNYNPPKPILTEDIIMFEKIKAIIVKHLKIDSAKITESTNLQEDLGADSLDLVEIIMEIENTFGIEIPDEDILGLKTISDVVSYIENKKN
jgi:acyl carrier protein